MNRALYLLISDPDEDELTDTTLSIGNLMNKTLMNENLFYLMQACAMGTFADDYEFVDMSEEFAVSAVLSSGRKSGSIISARMSSASSPLISDNFLMLKPPH